MKIPNNISTGEMVVVLRAKSQKDDRSRLTQEERDWFLSAARMIEYLEKEVDKLQADSAFLACLEACGVDNWQGYEEAQEMLEEEN
jgi:hypothetical protein